MSENAWPIELAILRLQRQVRMHTAESQRAERWRQVELMTLIVLLAVAASCWAGLF